MIPETPDSKMNGSSMLNESAGDLNNSAQKYQMSKYDLALINHLELPIEHVHRPSPSAKLIKSKTKGKNILRLNTKSGEIGFKDENKRKRKKV